MLFDPETLRLVDSLSRDDTPRELIQSVSDLRSAGHSPERVHHVLEQVRLRRKARLKFDEFADAMLFTEPGLEQATRLSVAAHHAGRFRDAGVTRIADLGCGIGADSMAFAALGLDVLAVERDPLTAAIARYNLASFDTVEVRVGDALTLDLSEVDGVWLDPARRDGGSRISRPDDWSPRLTEAFDIARTRTAGIKLAPGMDRGLIPEGTEAQWVSYHGDVVEMVLWWGGAARESVGRSALVLGPDSAHEMTAPEDSVDADVQPVGEFLYDPDGAVIRARLIGDLARSMGGWMIDPTIAYISSSTYHPTPFAAAFRIEHTLPVNVKALARAMREHDVGTLEIKKRGVDIDPALLRKKLPLDGSQSKTLILTRLAGQKVALLATRIDP